MPPVKSDAETFWFNNCLRRVKQQNLLRLVAALLWFSAALTAYNGNMASMLESPSLVPLGLMLSALALQCVSTLLPQKTHRSLHPEP